MIKEADTISYPIYLQTTEPSDTITLNDPNLKGARLGGTFQDHTNYRSTSFPTEDVIKNTSLVAKAEKFISGISIWKRI